MSDIREQLLDVVNDIYANGFVDGSNDYSRGDEMSDLYVEKIISLFPVGWQSFEEAKPDVGWKIWIRTKGESEVRYWGKVTQLDLDYFIKTRQWLHIPE